MIKSNYFKKTLLALFLLVIFLFFSPELSTCQQFSVVSTSPADGAANVDTTITLEITFNAPLDTTVRFPVPGDLFLGLIIPETNPMGEPDSVTLSQDLKTIKLHNIKLWADTQYFFGITAAKSQGGELLDLPYVLNFTTGAALPTGSVSGTVTFTAGEVRGTVVSLFTDMLSENGVVAGAVVNQSTGEYTINYVDDGEYLVVALKDTSKDGDLNPFEQNEPFGAYDEDSDNVPDYVSVASGQNVTGINIELQYPQLQTAKHWFEAAENFAKTSMPDAALGAAISENFQTDGKSAYWLYFFLSPSQQRLSMLFVVNGFLFLMDEGDSTGENDFLPIAEGWIDSDVAADSALANGGQEFLNMYPGANSQAWLMSVMPGQPAKILCKTAFNSKRKLKKQISLPKLTSVMQDTLTIWYIDYSDDQSGDNLTLLLDAFTGEPVTPGPTFEPTTARFNLDAANQAATNWAADAQLAMVSQHQGELTPDGKTEMWFFIYFSTSLDSERVFFLSNGQVFGQDYPDWSLPTRNALPANWIDSDAAMSVAETNNGSLYRNSNNDVWVTGGVSRGFYPMLPDSAVWWIDYTSSTSDPMSIYVDAVTGELITPDTTLVEFTARYRLPDADQEAKNWSVDAVLIHVAPGSPLPPDGKSSIWVYSYYSSSQSTSRIYYAMVAGPISSEELNARLPSNEALPENWIDSDVATAAAEANGGGAYRSRNPNTNMVGNVSRNMLEYYGRPSQAVWRFVYASDTESTMFIFIDAVSGAFLSTKTDVATDARYNLEAANFCAQGFAGDAKLTFVMNNTGSLDEQGRSSDSWLFVYYSAVKDNFISYQILAGQVVFVYPFGGGHGSKDALPDNWMNSSQAVPIADAAGGSAFRGEGVTVQGFLTKNFPGDSYDVTAETAVWFIQYLGTEFKVMINAVTGEVIPPIIPGVALKNEQKIIPEDYSLSQNYPNPFNPETTIEYGLPQASNIEIVVFNLQGQKITTLTKSNQSAGYHQIKWDGNDENGFPVASGVYLYQLKAGNSITVKKMALLR